MNNMLTLEEVKNYLEIEQKELEKYIGGGKLHAYKIGGTYIRFRKEEVLHLRNEVLPAARGKVPARVSFFSRIYDFWRFNNFYIISLAIIAALAYYIIRT